MKIQKINDINFLLQGIEQYMQNDISPEIENTYQTLLNLKSSLQKQ